MEVTVGKYHFIITENVNTWNNMVINKTYAIGGNISDCANIYVNFNNNVAISANMQQLEQCSLGEPLDKGTGSIIMIKTLLSHIKHLYPQLGEITFDDMSSITVPEATEEDIEKNKSRVKKKKHKLGSNAVVLFIYCI